MPQTDSTHTIVHLRLLQTCLSPGRAILAPCLPQRASFPYIHHELSLKMTRKALLGIPYSLVRDELLSWRFLGPPSPLMVACIDGLLENFFIASITETELESAGDVLGDIRVTKEDERQHFKTVDTVNMMPST